MNNLYVEKIDNEGKGISFSDDKIIFIEKALPGDKVDVKVLREKKKFINAKVVNYIEKSSLRKSQVCPYSHKCGGCSFIDCTYEDSLDLKISSVKNYFIKNGIDNEIKIIKNSNNLNFRNKVSLKIVSGRIGFYENNSNKLVEITKCAVANPVINSTINQIKKIGIKNGFITIRVNYLNEVILVINSKEDLVFDEIDVHGIILNNELVKGEKFFFDKINDLIFEVNYNSFFQVNPYITSDVCNILNKYISKEDIVLDLYSGVGLLGLSVASKAKKVMGFESIKEAVINANNNALINNIENAKYKYQDLSKKIVVNKEFNTLIIDPPRNGIDKIVMDFILDKKPNKILYMSCNPSTFIRDIKLLKEYYFVNDLYLLDMFSYSYHLESLCILERK